MKKHFLIENKNDSEAKVMLFGCGRHLMTENFGSDKGVDINVMKTFDPQPASDGEYVETLKKSSEEPFRIKEIQFDCKDESYVKEVHVNHYMQDANGRPFDKDYYFKTCQKEKTNIAIDMMSEISFYLKPKQIIHVLINQ
jgi:hypothetical protein